MNKNLTRPFTFLRHLALGGAVVMAVGCGADQGPVSESQPAGEQFLEDTGTKEQDEALESRTAAMSEGEKNDIFGVIGTVCGVVNVVQGISDAKATEFKLGTTAGSIGSGAATTLLETYNSSFVKYGQRDWGINLVWSSTAPSPANIELHKKGGGTINYGDKVALRVNGGGFVKYGSRTWGINLVWVSSNTTDIPYEWEVRGGATGTAVPKNTKVRLYNGTEKDNLVYCKRPTGINLGWAKDCTDIPGLGRYRTGYCP